ncbi:Ceramide glucosyltransferase [Exophiala sideris]|nr:Ceramide glucosyltransferase [Exophiala sideris]
MYTEIIARICIAWYIFIACVCTIGYVYLFIHYRRAPDRAAVLSKPKPDIPHVTIIRPCKGIEPYLYECLASTFQQDYPRDKITVYFCVSSRSDTAYKTIEAVVKDHPDHDARIYIEEEDNEAADQESYRAHLGPNPKIRNMSRAYREAKGDLIWIIDCNVWVGPGICARTVDRVCGFTTTNKPATPYKLVHHLPISVDVDNYSIGRKRTDSSAYDETSSTDLGQSSLVRSTAWTRNINRYGGRLEELFLSSAHAKMYVAINMVAVAPCIVGKSNMFRRSHLDHLTSERARLESQKQAEHPPGEASTGIDYFSRNICEDHLIGDLLWKSKVPSLPGWPKRMRNHGLVLGDLAIQPVSGMTVANYIARRVRWLRVRKFTVPTATLVEPGTESFLCSAYGAFGVTTCQATRTIFGETWTWFCLWWLVSIAVWAAVDWTVYLLLHSGRTIEAANDEANVPEFATPLNQSVIQARRSFKTWLYAWLGREALALPVWTWAIWGGATVTWRDRRFWVGLDMKVHEIRERREDSNGISRLGHANGRANGNAHIDGKKRTE